MQNSAIETLVGMVVVVVAGALLYFAYSSTHTGNINGYAVTASFSSADGVTTGTDVLLHGIKIGTVSSMDLDPRTYQAVLHLSIRNDVRIPDDSSIKITSASLLGGAYLAVTPGGSDEMLRPGATVTDTQGSIDIMGLIGRVIYGNSSTK